MVEKSVGMLAARLVESWADTKVEKKAARWVLTKAERSVVKTAGSSALYSVEKWDESLVGTRAAQWALRRVGTKVA